MQTEDFDITEEISRLTSGHTDIGAIVTFTGQVRDFDDGRNLRQLTLEHYSGLAEKKLRQIAETARGRWPLTGVTVIHKYGTLAPGDQIVLVVTTAKHRQPAFDAANFLMDWLKTDAPFWKKEITETDSRWVEARGEDLHQKHRWGT